MKRLSTLFSLLLLAVMSVWAEQVVLSTPSNSLTTYSDEGGIITITDAKGSTGIQQGSGTIAYEGGSATPMKLSGSRLFNLSYSSDVTVNKVTLYATTNKNDTESTIGTSGDDKISLGTLPKKGADPLVVDITGKTSLCAAAQFLAVIVVDYTVSTPTLKVSPEALSFSLNPNAQSKKETFTLTARNLTDGSYSLTVPSVDGLSVEPTSFMVANGSCDQEFAVTYASTVDVAKADATISAIVGNLKAEVAVTYQSRATAYTQSTVSAEAAWDWSKLSETVELTAETTPTKSEEFLLADLDDRINFTEAFGDAMAIKMENMQFPSRGGYAQGSTIKFTTSVAGTIAVDFSNTGSNRPYRYLTVNGKATDFKTNSVDKVSATEIAVPAGEVVISCILDPNAASNFDGYDASKHGVAGAATMVRYYKIAFTPAAEPVATTATFNFADENFRENIGEKLTDVKGNIYNETFTASGVSLQVTAGSAASKIYVDANRGQNLVTYKEYATLTFRAPEGMAITQIAFTAAGNSNIDKFTASSGAIEGMTWTGNADGVRFAQGGTSYLANAVVTLAAATAETATLADITYTECANIAAFNALAGGTYAKVTLTDAEVTGISADGYSTAWIQDATGGCWIQYCSLISQLKEKTKINGTVYVVARANSGNMHMKDAEGTPNSKLSAIDIESLTVAAKGSISEVNVDANKNKVVTITGSILSLATAGKVSGTLTDGDVTLAINNGNETANQQLHKLASMDSYMDREVVVTGILVGNGATKNQILPISIEVVETADATFDFKTNNYGYEWATGLSEAGNIAGEIITVGDVSMTNVNGNTATRLFTNSSKGNHLQVYKGATLLLHAAEGKAITKIEFRNTNGGAMKLTAQEGNGTQTDNVWVGNATTVKFDNVSSTAYIDSILVYTAEATEETFTPAALVYTEVADIAAFNALETGTLAKLTLNNARVNGYYDSMHTYYVEDASGATEFVQLPVSLKGGDVLNGFVYVKKDYDDFNYDHKARQAEDFSKNDFTVTEGTLEGTAVEVAAAGDPSNVGKLMTISNVMVGKEGRFFYAYDAKNNKIQVKDEMAVLTNPIAAGVFSQITGIVIFNGARWEIMPISDAAMVAGTEFASTFNFADENFRENIGEKLADVKGNIYNETFTASGVSLQVTAGSAASKIYVDANRGQNLVTYKEYATLTFRAPEGMAITQIAFTAAGNSNINKFTASSGAIEGMTWTGNADGVRFAQGGTSYLANAVVTLAAETEETAELADIEYTECANIAAFNALAGGTYAKVTLTDAEVIGISADGYSTAWIQDATGGCWIQYCSLISQLKEKTKVNGTVYVVARSNSGNMQMKDAEGTPNSELTATDITDYTMVEGRLSVVNVEANKNKVVKITGTSFVATGTNTGTLKQGVSTITVNNGTETANQQLHKIAEEWTKDETSMKGITIVAILVGKSATENQLLPISMEKETTTGITTVNATDGKVTIYNLQGVQQNKLKKGLNIVNGKKIVIK